MHAQACVRAASAAIQETLAQTRAEAEKAAEASAATPAPATATPEPSEAGADKKPDMDIILERFLPMVYFSLVSDGSCAM